MIKFNNVKKTFGGQLVFDNVSFTINKGEKCGLVGLNGSGKSTLLRMMIGSIEEDGGVIDVPKYYSLGYLEQHINFTQPTILEEAALGLPQSQKDALYKVETILFGLGLEESQMDLNPNTLSGGYQLRLHLAKVLVSDPDCLLLDEPTNYLDIVSIRWLERFLGSWKKELVLITHDRDFMDLVTTHTIGIHRHKVNKAKGGTEEYFQKVLEQEEIHERSRVKLDKKKEHVENFIRRFGAKATKAKQAQSKMKNLQRLPTLQKLAQVEDLDFGFNYSTFNGKRLLKAQDVYFKYSLDQDEFLINDLNLEIEQEDCIAVIGKNGRGKSTILNILAGLLPPVEGEVVPSPNLKIGHFGQTNIDRLNPKHTVEEEIASANHNLSVTDVRGICGVMMFDGDKAKKSISVLSGGERSRVLLGKILATPCNILFLDEPTHHLDMESIEALISAINEFPGVVIIVTHSEQILKQLPITKLLICRNHTQELMIGDYMDFLEKDGWGDDKEAAKQNKSQKEKVSQQDQKKLSAEIRQQISQNLGPLRKRMEELEKLIVKNEKLLATANDKLIEASEAEQSALIQKFSKEIATVQKQIDNDFAELDSVSKEYESKKLAFENQ